MSESAARQQVDPETPIKVAALSEHQQQLMRSRLLASKFGNMVSVLMQSEAYASLPLLALRSRIVPPLMHDQFRLAEVSKNGSGNTIPAAMILWAQVSDSVHDRMMKILDAPFELAAAEWKSGDNFWIVDAVGVSRFLTPLITELRKTEFKDQKVHYRARSDEGPIVKLL